MSKHPKRPRDPNQLAHAIVQLATGNVDEPSPPMLASEKNPAAVELGRRGGLKGGKARSESLTPEARREIAQRAAAARWKRDR